MYIFTHVHVHVFTHAHVHVHTCIYTYMYTCTFVFPHVTEAVFLISSYDAPLAQRASYLALHSSLFGPDGAVNYDYIVTNSINSLYVHH